MGLEKFKEAKDSNGGNYRLDETNDPVLTKCYPPGVPRVYFHPYPFEVVHTPKQSRCSCLRTDHWLRRVFTDGRKRAERSRSALDGPLGWPLGAEHFVVETVGFNDKTWLDRLGHAHSDQLKVTERFRRVDRDHLQLDITMEDPEALAKPWTNDLVLRAQAEVGAGRDLLLGRLSGLVERRGEAGEVSHKSQVTSHKVQGPRRKYVMSGFSRTTVAHQDSCGTSATRPRKTMTRLVRS